MAYRTTYRACMWVSTAQVCRYLLRGWGTGKNRNMPLSPARITDHRKLPQVGKPNFRQSDNFIMDFMLNRLFCPSGKTGPENRQKTGKSGKTGFLGVIMRMRVFLVWKTWKNIGSLYLFLGSHYVCDSYFKMHQVNLFWLPLYQTFAAIRRIAHYCWFLYSASGKWMFNKTYICY